MANIEFIRKQHVLKGKSIRQIARETGYARQTVRKATSQSEVPKYQRSIPYPQPVLLQWLKEDQSAPQKQRHSAAQIYRRLVEEYEFTGGCFYCQTLLSAK